MNIQIQLGMRVRYLRNQKHMSIEELALESKLSANYLCELENGKRNPSLNVLDKISRALDISLSSLLEGLETF